MEAPFNTIIFWLIAYLGVILTGISKSGFAGGAGVLAVPLIALLLPVPQAVVIMLPILIVMDIKTLQYYKQHIDILLLKKLIFPALVGIAIGGLTLGIIPEKGLQAGLGILCIIFALWHTLNKAFKKLASISWFWAYLSGFTSTLIHAGGPPINIFLIHLKLPKLTWLATSAAFFGLMNLIKTVPYMLNKQWSEQLLNISLLLLPAAFIGVYLGKHIQTRLSEQHFSLVCRYLLLTAGLSLIAKVVYTVI